MTSPQDRIDVEGLKARALGGGFVTVCQHPDLSEGLPSDSFDRTCVLDRSAPEDCDQSSPVLGGAVTAKAACPYWLPMQQTKPKGLTPDETLELIAQRAALVEAMKNAAVLLNRWLAAANGQVDAAKLRMTAHPVHDDTVEFLADIIGLALSTIQAGGAE